MTEAKHSQLLSCPFCNEEPSFTDVELKDERRYAEKLLRCCSIEMSATLSFGQYKDLTDLQIDHQLRSELAKSWNTRAATSLHHELVAALEAAQAHFLKYTGGFAANKEEATVFDKMRSALQKAKQGDKP